MKKKLVFIIFFILNLIMLLNQKVYAGKTDVKIDEETNDVVFKTEDTAASNSIRWRTIGFTVRFDISKGNPLKDDLYSTFMINEAEKESIVDNDTGIVTTTFRFPEDYVEKAFKKIGGVPDNGTIYMNGIFQTFQGSTIRKDNIRTLDDIKNAEGWANPDDFDDRFDLPLEFSTKYPVNVEYFLYDTELGKYPDEPFKKEKVGESFPYSKVKKVTLPETMEDEEGGKYEISFSNYAYLKKDGDETEVKKTKKVDSTYKDDEGNTHKYTASDVKQWSDLSMKRKGIIIRVYYKLQRVDVDVYYIRKKDGSILKKLDTKEKIPLTMYTISLSKTISNNGKTYKIVSSYVNSKKSNTVKWQERTVENDGYETTRKRSDKVYKSGLNVYAVMEKISTETSPPPGGGSSEPIPDEPEDEIPEEDEIEVDLNEPEREAIIYADERYSEKFDVEEGIPSNENLYVNVFATKYLGKYRFVKKIVKREYKIKVIELYAKTYQIDLRTSAQVASGIPPIYSPTTTYGSFEKEVIVKRYGAYWIVENFDIYSISSSNINNDTLPSGNVELIPANEYSVPTANVSHSSLENDHVLDATLPTSNTVYLPTLTAYSSDTSIPAVTQSSDSTYLACAYNNVGKLKVRNDSLTFNGQSIMTNEWVEYETNYPMDVDISEDIINENILYKNNLTIPVNKENKIYTSTGTITYKCKSYVGNSSSDLTYDINNINSVIVHTPVICDAQISDNKADNQLINPSNNASLVLNRSFSIQFPLTGFHSTMTGYGYRDYSKYTLRREVNFPFDVYLDNNIYYQANTWIPITKNITNFFLPIWVTEGIYSVKFRSISVNAEANNGLDKTQNIANTNRNNYVATDIIDVEVSGRLYNFRLYDVADYPTWDFFRNQNSLKLKPFYYKVGTKNENGINNSQNFKFTFPIFNGSHPKNPNIGVLKTGYGIRYAITTIGTMNSDNDYIHITPRFYYVDSMGKNRREVDIYYSESFEYNGIYDKQNLVKVGSEKDSFNKKTMAAGEVYLSIPEEEIKLTSKVTGLDEEFIKSQSKNVWTYKNIMIPNILRMYVGSLNIDIPNNISKNDVIKSIQHWYGEYYLPSEIHIVEKDFDLEEYSKTHKPFDYTENIWLKNGYLIVNFDIETIKDGKKHLSYINESNYPYGYCNMWNREGFVYNKEDSFSNKFDFIDGDFVLFYTDYKKYSAMADYKVGGTH